MQVLKELLKTSSLTNINKIVTMVENDPELVKILISITVGNGNEMSMRASWVLSHCYDKMPEVVKPFLSNLIKASPHFTHTGTRRNILRILSFEKIDENDQVFLFDHCLEWVISKKEPIAVRANAMEILANIAMQQPDLKNEVIPVILDIIPHGSMGLKSKGRKVLKKLGFYHDKDELAW